MKIDPSALLFNESGSLNGIKDLRNQYLDSLPESQELYLELMVNTSRGFLITLAGRRLGYFLLGKDNLLLEFFITQEFIDQADAIFTLILHNFGVQKVLCKTFDPLLLSSCLDHQKRVSTIDFLFREFKNKKQAPLRFPVFVRPAKQDDEKHIIEINEQVFDHDNEVSDYIQKAQLLLFENQLETIGFGIFTPTIKDRPECDIGMLVVKNFRRQGIGESGNTSSVT